MNHAAGWTHHQPAWIDHTGDSATSTVATATGQSPPVPCSQRRIAVPVNITARIAAPSHGTKPAKAAGPAPSRPSTYAAGPGTGR